MVFEIEISKDKVLIAELREPLFREYRFATMELLKTPGYTDQLACGSSLVQHCWVGGDEKLKKGDESEDPEIAKAYTALALEVYLQVYAKVNADVKKK